MPSLRELQQDFTHAIFGGAATPALWHSTCPDPKTKCGLAAYRNSILANLAGAVIATYPVIERIVGHDFLAAAARRYAAERPSTSGDLNAYGHDFDDFLVTYEPAAELPYLPAVARLEWQVQLVEGASDAPAQDFSALAATPPADWGMVRFQLDPAHARLASEWPLARLWAINQPGYDGDFSVDFDTPQTVLIHRRASGVAVEEISMPEDALLAALSAGHCLESSVDAASRQGAVFDLQAALQRFIACGLLRQTY